jgi:hypothetical protein
MLTKIVVSDSIPAEGSAIGSEAPHSHTFAFSFQDELAAMQSLRVSG